MTRNFMAFLFLIQTGTVASQPGQEKLTSTGEHSTLSKKEVELSPFGKWRGVFLLKDGIESPFLFDITGTTPENAKVYFINGEERFENGRIKVLKDSLFISVSQFDNELVFKMENDSLTGILRRQDKTGIAIPAKAKKGNQARFPNTGVNPVADFSGTYDIIFKNGKEEDEKAIGLFKQEGNKLKATFLRITGDSRYLEGIVSGNEFYLSTFIGSGSSLYKGVIKKNGHIEGKLITARSSQTFTGVQNEDAALPDASKLTYLKDGYTSLDFVFPDTHGKPVSLKDDKYKNKVVILTITGTWCPNCVDEASFLAPWYKENKNRGVEIIALHYERKMDTAYARKAITRFRERFGITYDAVFAGVADKQYVAESLPALNSFLSFPTIIFIDKKGKVAKIHAGYNGPATGKYYDQFIKEFNKEVDWLVKQ